MIDPNQYTGKLTKGTAVLGSMTNWLSDITQKTLKAIFDTPLAIKLLFICIVVLIVYYIKTAKQQQRFRRY